MIGVRKLMIQKSYGAVNDCLRYYDLSPLRGDSARRAQRLPLTRELSKISVF